MNTSPGGIEFTVMNPCSAAAAGGGAGGGRLAGGGGGGCRYYALRFQLGPQLPGAEAAAEEPRSSCPDVR